MKKLFIFSFICFLSEISFGQTGVDNQRKAELANDPNFIAFKKRHDDLTKGQVSQVSLYFDYDQTLKTYFVGDAIPAETPKAIGIASKTEYVKTLNEWISKNKNLLKPEHKNSLITE